MPTKRRTVLSFLFCLGLIALLFSIGSHHLFFKRETTAKSSSKSKEGKEKRKQNHTKKSAPPSESPDLSKDYHTMSRRGNTYLVTKKGKLVTKEQKYKKQKYYVRLNGTVSCIKKGKRLYKPSGKMMTEIEKRDVRARNYAKAIIRDITKKNMTKEEKLQTCFQWVVHNYSYAELDCRGEEGWTTKSGIEMLQKGIGDCRALAVGFAYLADELGYDDACLCQDSKNKFSGAHCWTSVDGKCYDPLFYNTKKPTRYLSVFNGSTPEAYLKKTHCSASQTFRPGS